MRDAASPEPFGSILDVEGIGVGHHQRVGRGWQTGTTVLTCRGGATPGVDVRGGGPGTRETDALRPENLVQSIHAVCLTGGSAYGLAAADGVMGVMESEGLGFRVGEDAGAVVPVVPTAVIFDLGRGGTFANRPDASFGERASRSALSRRRSPVAWGSVGAGAGALGGGLQGGVGTASTIVTTPSTPDGSAPGIDITVGAVAVVNANGSPFDPATGLPWFVDDLDIKRPTASDRSALRDALTGAARFGLNTTIGVVATSARLSKAESSKMATVAHDGMARAIRPAHSMTDGDTVFTMATGHAELPCHPDATSSFGDGPNRIVALNLLLDAAANCFAQACTHAVIAATSIGDRPAWRDLCPSALL